jgi:transposase-like protein
MSGHGGKIKRKLEDAVAAMLTQRNVEEAAREVDVSVATLMRWQKLPEFQVLYREGRRAVYSQAVARLQQGTAAAAATLLKTMIDTATPASVKIRAAEAIFNHAAKAIEIQDIDARLTALEASSADQGARGR